MPEQKDATRFTEAANNRLLIELNWDDTQERLNYGYSLPGSEGGPWVM